MNSIRAAVVQRESSIYSKVIIGVHQQSPILEWLICWESVVDKLPHDGPEATDFLVCSRVSRSSFSCLQRERQHDFSIGDLYVSESNKTPNVLEHVLWCPAIHHFIYTQVDVYVVWLHILQFPSEVRVTESSGVLFVDHFKYVILSKASPSFILPTWRIIESVIRAVLNVNCLAVSCVAAAAEVDRASDGPV